MRRLLYKQIISEADNVPDWYPERLRQQIEAKCQRRIKAELRRVPPNKLETILRLQHLLRVELFCRTVFTDSELRRYPIAFQNMFVDQREAMTWTAIKAALGALRKHDPDAAAKLRALGDLPSSGNLEAGLKVVARVGPRVVSRR